MGLWRRWLTVGTIAKDGWQWNEPGTLISKKNHSKVIFEAHTSLLRIPHSTSWRTPREPLTKCPGSIRTYHLRVGESATSEDGMPGTSEALQALSSMLFVRKDRLFYGSWEDWGFS